MKNRFFVFIMAIALIITFGIFIYPGIYRYDKLDQKYPVKINRFTGETKILKDDYWHNIRND